MFLLFSRLSGLQLKQKQTKKTYQNIVGRCSIAKKVALWVQTYIYRCQYSDILVAYEDNTFSDLSFKTRQELFAVRVGWDLDSLTPRLEKCHRRVQQTVGGRGSICG